MTKEENFLQFVQARSTPGSLLPLAQLWTTWRDITADYMQSYMAKQGKDATFSATIAAGEMLFTPPSCIVCERGQASASFGLRMSIVRPPHYEDLLKVLNVVERGIASGSAAKSALRLAVEDPFHLPSNLLFRPFPSRAAVRGCDVMCGSVVVWREGRGGEGRGVE